MPATLTIVYRGLMVLYKDAEKNIFEIGMLPAPGHYPRINTIKNGVLESVFPLYKLVYANHPIWDLKIEGASTNGVSIYTSGSSFNRMEHEDERDFRWTVDLEGDEFYNTDLTAQLKTNLLAPVLRIPSGLFYTRLKSHVLQRTVNGQTKDFGSIAAVGGIDISLEGTGAQMVFADTGATIFSFPVEANTIYEIANTPPDVEVEPMHGHGLQPPDGMSMGSSDHFQFYYLLFKDPNVSKFEFRLKPSSSGGLAPPAPDPLLCGETLLSKRSVPLR